MSKQTLSFDAFYTDYKTAAENANVPVLDKPLLYFAFIGGFSPDDAATMEAQVNFEAQHERFVDEHGYSLKERPEELPKLLDLIEDPDDEDDDEDSSIWWDDEDDDDTDEDY